ncbi:MAG: hypothetical protein QOG62_2793 [Thermoleophilaceae bacterium]|jgi:lysophospholipase L1-like esterase|nr:hypothetical protein [Thermoleophilaceae bacterium]
MGSAGGTRRTALAVGAVFAMLALTAPAGAAAPEVYVSLGDSYTSGPLVLNPVGDPLDCARSDHNYPSVVANSIRPDVFRDVSCGSATTDDLRSPQRGLPLGGTNPPQFNGLSRDTTLVTMGMGGNDSSIAGTAEDCLSIDATIPTGSPCKEANTFNGVDRQFERIRQTKAKIRSAIKGIQRRSPRARILIVGYPAAVPPTGDGCWPFVPISSGDVHWLGQQLQRLNRVLIEVSRQRGVEYVNTWDRTVGHDACQPPGPRWFEGLIPTAPAFPLHPNTKGEAAMARAVLDELRQRR